MNYKNLKKILVVDDEPDMRWILTNVLKKKGYRVITADDGKKAVQKVIENDPDIILLDIRMPEMDGIQVLEKVREINPSTQVIIITAFADVKNAVQAMKLGAHDYLIKPFDNSELLLIIERVLEKKALDDEVKYLRNALEDRINLSKRMGKSTKVDELVDKVKKVASSDFSVLILGESGTGKELVAEAIYRYSARRMGQLVEVDCGAIPETLIESELFGYERGAFTGAYKRKKGYFEAANKGTLFLDEISNLSKSIQMKLLRAIQNKKIAHLGSTELIPVDVRIVCASNEDILKLVEKGTFRRDLFYRINEFRIDVPPLRERKDDILYLANMFLKEASEELSKKLKGFSEEARKFLLLYDWPGNVRELKNVVRRSVLVANRTILPEHFPDELKNSELFNIPVDQIDSMIAQGFSWKELKKNHQKKFEEQVIKKTLKRTNGNKLQAAKNLKMDYKTFHTKVKELDLNKNQLNK
ncbi:MAG: sigma-54-dependent Fis family transcriptional regulator [Candidatus Marinimicrobia bacterium]|nr:sigma-54-dependent Fis family transcriptional regulator [Candidatus Neomarinimicrobiota bacterium]